MYNAADPNAPSTTRFSIANLDTVSNVFGISKPVVATIVGWLDVFQARARCVSPPTVPVLHDARQVVMILYFLQILHRQVSAKQQRYLREVHMRASASHVHVPMRAGCHGTPTNDSLSLACRW